MSNTTKSTNAQINVRDLPKIPVTTEDFMGTLVGYDAEVNILVFPDKGGKFRNVTTNKVAVNRFAEWAKEEGLCRVHHKSCGVHWKPNLGGTKEAEIDTFTCQFVESDDLSLEEQYEALMEAPLKPTAIVRTKKSLHAYYKVNQATATLALWKAVQAQLIAYFHGDPSRMSANASCRLPGFYHCKGDPIPVDVIYWAPENVYEQEDIHKAFPAVELPSKEEVDQERVLCKQRGLDNVLVNCDFFSYCKNHEHLPYLDWFNMINILTFLEDGLAIAHEYSKHDPRYKEEETEKVFLDAKKSSPGPTTCDKLMLGAFDCPKRKAGTCKCKSPLVWTLKPMEYNVLHEKISGLGEVPAEEGMNMAKEFVRKFLFNVERRTAKPLVKELATVLKLTEADTITLYDLQKAELDAFQSNAKGCQTKYEKGLDKWYVTTNSGIVLAPMLLSKHLAKKAHAFFLHQDFYYYQDGVYQKQPQEIACRIIAKYLHPDMANSHQIEDVLKLWMTEALVLEGQVDTNINLINLENGLFNVETNELTPHTPDYLSTIRIHASYDPEAKAPVFTKFLEESLPDPEQQHLMLQIIGYLMLKINVAQKLFILLGQGGTGKSSMLRVIEGLLGEENISGVPLQSLSKDFALANLMGKLVNISGDLPAKKFEETSEVKTIVGNDTVNINRKHRDGVNVRLFTRLIASCNTIPPAYCDQSTGWFRRFLILEFNNAVPEGEQNPHLNDEMAGEKNGIFLMALPALKSLMQESPGHKAFTFATTQVNKDLLNSYRRDSNSAIAFAEDCLDIDTDCHCTNADLRKAYDDYCMEEGIAMPMSLPTLVKRLSEWNRTIHRDEHRIKGQRGVRGIKIKDFKEESSSEQSSTDCPYI